jgi:hypothetical protein
VKQSKKPSATSKPPTQPPSAAQLSALELVHIAPSDVPLSAAQLKFNRLTEQIRSARVELAAWQANAQILRDGFTTHVEANHTQNLAVDREIALKADALFNAPPRGVKMTDKRTEALSTYILHLIEHVLDDCPDDAQMLRLHAQYSDTPHKPAREEAMDNLRDMLKSTFGAECVDADIQDPEELVADTQRRYEQRHHAPHHDFTSGSAPSFDFSGSARARKPTPRQRAAQDARAAAQEALSQSLREIYRKLASSLHPDREPDAALKAHKTLLMQRINIAYEKKDLLALLSLQIEVEQLKPDALARVPEERLAQYNQILAEQLSGVKRDQAGLIGELAHNFDIDPRRAPKMAHFERALAERKRAALDKIAAAKAMLRRLNDPRQHAAIIEELVNLAAAMKRQIRQEERHQAQMDELRAQFDTEEPMGFSMDDVFASLMAREHKKPQKRQR